MRTAEEHIDGNTHLKESKLFYREELIKMINEARKEAIEECARRMSVYLSTESHPSARDVKSILLPLINELK